MGGPSPAGVPVVPNASQVRGEVKRVTKDAAGPGETWEILIQEAADVPGVPNFVSRYLNQPIQVYVGPAQRGSTATQPGATVNLRVEYRGDERGGLFVATGSASDSN